VGPRGGLLSNASLACSNRLMGVQRPDGWTYLTHCQHGHPWVRGGCSWAGRRAIARRAAEGTGASDGPVPG